MHVALSDHTATTVDLLVGADGVHSRVRRLAFGDDKRQQRAARRIAKWFVPDDELHLIARDLITRASAWPVVAAILRRRMAAQSILSSPR